MQLEFAYPWFLLLLPLPVLLLLLRWRTRRAALRYPSVSLLAGIPRARLPVIVGESLRFLAVLAAVLALSGPRSPDLKTRMPVEGIAMIFVLDTSGSMQTKSFEWEPGSAKISRAEAAKRAFKLFVAGGDAPDGTHFDGRSTERGTDAVGLITFTNWPHPVCPPTLNHSVLLTIFEHVEPPTVRDTGTNIGDALAEGVIRLDRVNAKRKVIVLLSDGEHNIDLRDESRQPLKPRQAASLAANLDIPIYTIDTGGDPKEADSIENRLAGMEINRQVAEMTGGRSFSASDGQQLLEVCKTIDAMESQPIVGFVYRRYHEYYGWLALAAFGFAALAFLLDQTIWRRIP